MANREFKNPLNIGGKFYCTDSHRKEDGCIGCGVCYNSYGDFFKEDDDGYAYVHRQPKTSGEVILCSDAVWECPVGSIGVDGEVDL